MPGSDISLETVIQYGQAASQYYAHTQIKKGSTQTKNNLLIGKGRFKALDKGINNVRNILEQRDQLEKESGLFNFEETIEMTSKFSLGNCHELACQALDYILNHVPEVEAELYEIKKGDHIFLVLNRKRPSDPGDPGEWGESAVICDPWANKVYKATEYHTELKNFYRDMLGNNRTEPLNRFHKLAPFTCYNTKYFRSIRTVEHLKESFSERVAFLVETLNKYRQQL